jgi:hypothetical protein
MIAVSGRQMHFIPEAEPQAVLAFAPPKRKLAWSKCAVDLTHFCRSPDSLALGCNMHSQ